MLRLPMSAFEVREGMGRASADGCKLPSRPGEFHPEPLTDPDLTFSRANMSMRAYSTASPNSSFSAMFRGVLRLLPHRWAVEHRLSEVHEFASSLDGEATGPVTIDVIAPCVSIFASMPTAASSRPSRARSASRHG